MYFQSFSARSGRTMARIGLRMMPTFPSSPLKFRTAGFPQYGFKAGISAGAFPQRRPRVAPSRFASRLRAHRCSVESPLSVGIRCAHKHRHSSGYAALPQGPSLRSGLFCPGPSSLIRPHPTHSQAQRDFTALQLIRPAFAVRFRLGDLRLVPCFHRSFFLNMSSSATPGSPAAVYTQFLHRLRWPSSL